MNLGVGIVVFPSCYVFCLLLFGKISEFLCLVHCEEVSCVVMWCVFVKDKKICINDVTIEPFCV